MNRTTLKESAVGRRNIPPGSQHRRGLSLNGISSRDADDNYLDLFSKNRRSLSITSSDESDVSVKLGRLSVGSAKVTRSGIEDLLSSTDGAKHDYDWLLTPPGTPLFPSLDASESQPALVASRSSSSVRSASTTKASRLSVSQSESNRPSRPTRSSSVSRPSITCTHNSTNSNRSSILNTSSASVSSYLRPSTPTTRSVSAARPSSPSSGPSISRSSTPSRTWPASTNSSIDKTRPSPTSPASRPSTPSSRPQSPANLNYPATRSASRPSTPTRRSSAPSLSSANGPSTTAGHHLSNGCNVGLTSRPRSPGPRVRPLPQPIVPLDFPLDTPQNLRTTLPDRPLSAGRSRPSSVTVKGSIDTPSTANRRQSSPIVSRGRLTEPCGKGRTRASLQVTDISDSQRTPPVSELSTRKPVKTSSTESTGFGRTISKKSMDMAIRHMDVRNGTHGIRPASALFPQSIRSANPRSQYSTMSSAPASDNGNHPAKKSGMISENENQLNRSSEKGMENNCLTSAKSTEVDIYESSRYAAILLREDLNSTNWLHSVDDKSNQAPIFDNGFEPLPEPFDHL